MLTLRNALALSAVLALTAVTFQAPAQADDAKAAKPAAAKEKKGLRRFIAQKAPAESTDAPKKADGFVPYADSSEMPLGE